jgi:osmoprotectant transport system substrate-binding protein
MRRFNIGGRGVAYPRIVSGAVSILPEYNGALLAYLTNSTTATSTSDVDMALTRALPASLTLLDPAPAEDKESLVVTADTAARYGLSSIADLARVPDLVVGGPADFESRQRGLVGLRADYGVNPKAYRW